MLVALTVLLGVTPLQVSLPPTPYDRSPAMIAKFDRMLARRDAGRVFPAFVRSPDRAQVIRELRQAGFEYRDGGNGCRYLTGGSSHGPRTAFVSFCGPRVRVEMGYSFF